MLLTQSDLFIDLKLRNQQWLFFIYLQYISTFWVIIRLKENIKTRLKSRAKNIRTYILIFIDTWYILLFSNLLTLCVESLFSPPESWTPSGQFSYAACLQMPVSNEVIPFFSPWSLYIFKVHCDKLESEIPVTCYVYLKHS